MVKKKINYKQERRKQTSSTWRSAKFRKVVKHMNDIRATLEDLNNKILALTLEMNSLKVECVKLITDTKVERSDILYTADELKKVKFSNGVGSSKLQKMIEEGLPQTILYEGAHPKYSDKAVDAWIASKQVRIGG